LSHNKVQLLFHRVPEILNCHTLFRIALSDAIKNWDRDEKIGDVFVANFSKAIVLEIYSDFINNFTAAMECAKQESKRKSALADFLKVKQITAHDRVSFFGLMVKPVQRFPQFILLLQDLLKETPPGHPDRMALQLALTTLESLAEMLNERKREAEQFAAFRDKMRNISGKFPPPKSSQFPGGSSNSQDGSASGGGSGGPGSQPSGSRFLLREDDMTQLEFNTSGLVARSKQRRLLLLNDLLVTML
jgi:Rho guanine nucleotide exchange factor 10